MSDTMNPTRKMFSVRRKGLKWILIEQDWAKGAVSFQGVVTPTANWTWPHNLGSYWLRRNAMKAQHLAENSFQT